MNCMTLRQDGRGETQRAAAVRAAQLRETRYPAQEVRHGFDHGGFRWRHAQGGPCGRQPGRLSGW